MRQDLDLAYRQTIYQVRMGQRVLRFQIGRFDPGAEQVLLAACGPATEWAILTPCNPASAPLCQQENEARLENFHHFLRDKSFRWVPTSHRDPDGHWPDEVGALVLDISVSTARNVARAYGQNAWVHTQLGQAPELFWVD